MFARVNSSRFWVAAAAAVAACTLSACGSPAAEKEIAAALEGQSLTGVLHFDQLFNAAGEYGSYYIGCPYTTREVAEFQVGHQLPSYPQAGPQEGSAVLVLSNGEANHTAVHTVANSVVTLCNPTWVSRLEPIYEPLYLQQTAQGWQLDVAKVALNRPEPPVRQFAPQETAETTASSENS